MKFYNRHISASRKQTANGVEIIRDLYILNSDVCLLLSWPRGALLLKFGTGVQLELEKHLIDIFV